MNGEINWGPEIAVEGKRPEWLACNDEVLLRECGLEPYKVSMLVGEIEWHEEVEAIRLPADHPHYATPQPRTAPSGGEAQVVRLRAAITRALQCTPAINPYRGVIEYDCGDPWAILREALLPEPVDPLEEARITLDVFLAGYAGEPNTDLFRRIGHSDDLLTWGHMRTILRALEKEAGR